MGRNWRSCAAAAALSFSVGCTSQISARRGGVPESEFQVPQTVVVGPLIDERPPEEVAGDPGFLRWWDRTYDLTWKHRDLQEAISREVAGYLQDSGVFAHVVYESELPGVLGAETLRSLKEKGYDLVLVGTIRHFHGSRRWDLDRSVLLIPAGPLGGVLNLLLGHRAEGHAQLSLLRILRTDDGTVVWEGEAEGNIEETTYLARDAGSYANEGLRRALVGLSARLDAASGEIAQRASCERTVRGKGPDPGDREGAASILRTVTTPFGWILSAAEQAGRQMDRALDQVRTEGSRPTEPPGRVRCEPPRGDVRER